ncbi:MAG: metalloregulator ArsR/SmtB family transcription factor [Chloroflexota bacterium]|nr:metalloregulator ArsR/SmtB family transcription factor [Chloroflexota bacterium]
MKKLHDIDELSTAIESHEADRVPESSTSSLTFNDAELYARFFQVLSDPTRVQLLHLLLDAPDKGRTVSELVAAVGAPQSRISTHLGCLRWCGLVHTQREGKQVYYQIADVRVRDLLALAGVVMRDYAAGIASCGVIR